jgi:hypothetical protein
MNTQDLCRQGHSNLRNILAGRHSRLFRHAAQRETRWGIFFSRSEPDFSILCQCVQAQQVQVLRNGTLFRRDAVSLKETLPAGAAIAEHAGATGEKSASRRKYTCSGRDAP